MKGKKVEKRLKEILARKLEIRGLLNSGKEIDLDALETELASLNTEVETIEKRSKIAAGLGDGSIAGKPIFENRSTKEADPVKKDRRELLASEEYRSAWLKNLQDIETRGKNAVSSNLSDVELRAITSAADSGGAVIPTITLNKVIERLYQTSVIFPLVSSLEIPSNLTIPFENETAEASWVDMDTDSVDSDDAINELSLSAHKVIKTIEIDADVAKMSIAAFETFIVNTLARKVKKAVDVAIISGEGAAGKQATGILTALAGTDYAITTKYNIWGYDDICDLFAALPTSYAVNGKIVLNRKFLYGTIAKIKDEVGRPIFIHAKSDDGSKQKGIEGQILGYPVVIYDFVPNNTIIFGDFEFYYFNWVQAFLITKSLEAGFRKGSIVYRALGLADGNVALKEAFVVQTLGTTAPPSGTPDLAS